MYDGFLAAVEFQSTLPVGGATPFPLLNSRSILISIHAPRGGSDWVCPVSVVPIL